MEFLSKSLEPETSEKRQQLLETLGKSMVALRLAVAYIRSKNEERDDLEFEFKVSDYLEEYEKKSEELTVEQFLSEEDRITSTTFQLTLDQIKKRGDRTKVLEMMQIIAYLCSDGVPIGMFSNLTQTARDLHSLIRTLEQLAVIDLDEAGRVFSVNSLIQRAIKRSLKTPEEDEVLEKILELLEKRGIEKDNAHQAMSVWEQAEKYDRLVKRFHKIASSVIDVGYMVVGNHQKLLPFGERALKIFEKALGMDHFGTIRLKNNLALVMCSQGKMEQAFVSHEENSIVLEQDPTLIIVHLINQQNKATVLANQGKNEESLRVHQSVYRTRKLLLGPQHPDTLISEGNVALLKFQLDPKCYRNSLRVLKKVVKGLENSARRDDHYILTFQANIGYLLNRVGKLDEALAILEEVYKKRSALLGPDHPFTTQVSREISFVWSERGDIKKALDILKQVVKAEEKALGADHSKTRETKMAIDVFEFVIRMGEP